MDQEVILVCTNHFSGCPGKRIIPALKQSLYFPFIKLTLPVFT